MCRNSDGPTISTTLTKLPMGPLGPGKPLNPTSPLGPCYKTQVLSSWLCHAPTQTLVQRFSTGGVWPKSGSRQFPFFKGILNACIYIYLYVYSTSVLFFLRLHSNHHVQPLTIGPGNPCKPTNPGSPPSPYKHNTKNILREGKKKGSKQTAQKSVALLLFAKSFYPTFNTNRSRHSRTR